MNHSQVPAARKASVTTSRRAFMARMLTSGP
jgi:hypothetical protein